MDGVWVGTIVGTAVGVNEGAPVGLRDGVAVGYGVKVSGRHVCCGAAADDHGSCCQAENWPPTTVNSKFGECVSNLSLIHI